MNIALCIPTLGPPTWGLFDSMGQWQVYHYQHHSEIQVDVLRPPRPLPIDVSRSWLVRRVLERDYDYLWFVDQDAKFAPETLYRLLAWNKPIVGALCLMRGKEPCWPMAYGEKVDGDRYRILADEVYAYYQRYGDSTTNDPQLVDPIPPDSLLPVTFTGCHSLLIHRAVLMEMSPPWFQGVPGQEDRNFCFKAAELDYQVYVDLSTFVGHLTGERSLGVFDFISHYQLFQTMEALNGQKG